MKRKITVLTRGALLFALCFSIEAQEARKVPRIGLLWNNPNPQQGRQATFRQTLRDLGWVEGENIVIEYRYAEGKADRFPDLAQSGGNVTGLSALGPELNTKRLEVIKDAIPKLTRVGFLRDM